MDKRIIFNLISINDFGKEQLNKFYTCWAKLTKKQGFKTKANGESVHQTKVIAKVRTCNALKDKLFDINIDLSTVSILIDEFQYSILDVDNTKEPGYLYITMELKA
ncbi:MAG: hypothetical protein ACRCWG_06610 [Sarcina sp.]